MMRMISWLSWVLCLLAIGLKMIYGRSHWLVAKLLRVPNLPYDIPQVLMSINYQLFIVTLLLSAISSAIVIISVNQKTVPSAIRVLGVLLSLVTIFIALIAM